MMDPSPCLDAAGTSHPADHTEGIALHDLDKDIVEVTRYILMSSSALLSLSSETSCWLTYCARLSGRKAPVVLR